MRAIKRILPKQTGKQQYGNFKSSAGLKWGQNFGNMTPDSTDCSTASFRCTERISCQELVQV